jgi:hypothetical protein
MACSDSRNVCTLVGEPVEGAGWPQRSVSRAPHRLPLVCLQVWLPCCVARLCRSELSLLPTSLASGGEPRWYGKGKGENWDRPCRPSVGKSNRLKGRTTVGSTGGGPCCLSQPGKYWLPRSSCCGQYEDYHRLYTKFDHYVLPSFRSMFTSFSSSLSLKCQQCFPTVKSHRI